MDTFTSKPRLALVSTVRDVAATIDSFILYHHALGFDHLFLFFDDPVDPALPQARAYPCVTAIPNDAALHKRWAASPLYTQAWAALFVASEVMSRQILNADVALQLAAEADCDWLLHIDADELFYAPDDSLRTHFANLTKHGIGTVRYYNYEVVPEQLDYGDFFRSATLFKKNPVHLQGEKRTAATLQETIPQVPSHFFHFYRNGKSAVRVHPSTRPHGVHYFQTEAGTQATRYGAPAILHYPCCGFDNFWQKYQTLGAFGDQWWDQTSIEDAIGSFHLESRDIVKQGTRDAARAFYNQRYAITNLKHIQRGLEAGIFTRITEPSALLQTLS